MPLISLSLADLLIRHRHFLYYAFDAAFFDFILSFAFAFISLRLYFLPCLPYIC